MSTIHLLWHANINVVHNLKTPLNDLSVKQHEDIDVTDISSITRAVVEAPTLVTAHNDVKNKLVSLLGYYKYMGGSIHITENGLSVKSKYMTMKDFDFKDKLKSNMGNVTINETVEGIVVIVDNTGYSACTPPDQ